MAYGQACFAADLPETSHLAFINDYVRELAENETLRLDAVKDMASAKGNDERFHSAIHASTLIQLTLTLGC